MGGTILIIDSDLLTLGKLEDAIPEGYETQRADSAAVGLKLARSPGVILVIINADLEQGWGAVARIRRDPETAQLPLIVMSAVASREQIAQHKSLPGRAQAYLSKPLDATELRHVLQRQVAAGTRARAVSPPSHTPQPEARPPLAPPPAAFDLGLDELTDRASAPARPKVAAPERTSDPALANPATTPRRSHRPAIALGASDDSAATAPPKTPDAAHELEDLRTRISALESENAQLRSLRQAMEARVQTESDRVRNLRMAATRVEQAHQIERQRLTDQVDALTAENADLGTAAASTQPDPALLSELRRLRAVEAEVTESFEIIRESLTVPLDIISRVLGETPNPESPDNVAFGD